MAANNEPIEEIKSVSDAIEIVWRAEERLASINDVTSENKALDLRYPFPFGLWFRGVPDFSQTLTPSVFRPAEPIDHSVADYEGWYDETMMIQHFRQRNPSYEQTYRNNFDLLCLMQHYNFPTRLLDWTESILIALCFAVENDKHSTAFDKQNGRIYCLNARRLNQQTRLHDNDERYICGSASIDVTVRSNMATARRLKDLRFGFELDKSLLAIENVNKGRSSYKKSGIHLFKLWLDGDLDRNGRDYGELMRLLSSPVAVFPNRLNPRMTSQLSMVLLYGAKKWPLSFREESGNGEADDFELPSFCDEKHALERLEGSSDFLKVFTIPADCKRNIREQLRRIGMHEAALFPELDHVGNFVRHEWTFPRPSFHSP